MAVGSAALNRPVSSAGRGWLVPLFMVWLAAAGAGYWAYERSATPTVTPVRGQRLMVERGTITATVNTTGSVVPVASSKIAFKSSGRLAELKVRVGDTVERGQVLARLDQNDLQLQVAQSRASLASAEAKLAQLLQGSRTEEIAAAESSLASAQAKLGLLKAGPTDSELQAAQASVAGAKSSLAAAQAKLAELRNRPKPEDVRSAQLELERAKNSLWATQLDRDGTCGNARNAEYQCRSADARVAASETAVTSAQENLKKVSLTAAAEDVKSAEEGLASAQASYDSAQAKLEQVKAGANAADIAAAQSSVDSALSQLATKRRPYTEGDVQAAKASVEQSKAALALSENNLANAMLVAPFNGNVAAIAMNLGEMTGGNSTIAIVDPKELRVDATVDESDVAKLEVGQSAEITLDSLPGRVFNSKVIAIAPSGTLQSGVVTYLVSLSVPDASGLKPGMTANANIVYMSRDNVLLVPNRAIRSQGRNRVVEVVGEAGNQTRVVQVGASNDQVSEIVQGLNEGDEIFIGNTTTSTPRVPGGMPGAGFGGPQPAPNVMVMPR